jgi:hypothetical protein
VPASLRTGGEGQLEKKSYFTMMPKSREVGYQDEVSKALALCEKLKET